jgi:hypothetical protein
MSPLRPLTVASLVLCSAMVFAAAAHAEFGFRSGVEGFRVEALEAGGAPDLRAASHPYQVTTTVELNRSSEPESGASDGDLQNLEIELPSGLIENPSVVETCSLADFATHRTSPFESSRSGESCPDASQVGVVALRTSYEGGSVRYFGVFNLEPPPGTPAQIGFSPFGNPVTFTPRIRGAEGEYGVTLGLRNLSQHTDVLGLKMTIWGTPWTVSHNAERGDCLNEVEPLEPWGKCSVGRPRSHVPKAYVTLPSACGAPLLFRARAQAWQRPGTAEASYASSRDGVPYGLEGCETLGLDFFESASALPTDEVATSASGLEFALTLASEGLIDPELLAPSQARTAELTLPEGMTINPSLGVGLEGCTPQQYEGETASTPPGAGCPNGSKIGTVSVDSPLFEEPLGGALYLAEPYDNPAGSMVALYMVVKSPLRGVIVKVAGGIVADSRTGQLVTTFEALPQLPYSHFAVKFREGRRAPLITPSQCGTYFTQTTLAPWANPSRSRVDGSRFQINGSCPSGPASFSPVDQAGSLNANAGSYSPFYLHLERTDDEAEITSYSATLPPGLLGRISGVPACSDADIAAARSTTGLEEERHPSCPLASEIGHTTVGYGVGGVLAYAPGKLYLAGPYHGAPLSIVAIDSALVGPFDLGTVVIRSAIEVDQRSAQVSIDSSASDPIPHILNGIPLHLRDIRVYISRPEFTVNPTNCTASSVAATLTGSIAPFTDPKGASSTVATAYRPLFCSSLPFKPALSLTLRGGVRRGDFPALTAIVRPRHGDANIGSAMVTLPPSEFLEQRHIGETCPKAKIEAEDCPSGAIYGSAEAITPLLESPMKGPVYLGTGYGHLLPELVTVLHGRGFRIVVEGEISSAHGGLRGTFVGLPDAPLTSFKMSLHGGKAGLLVNSANACTAPTPATARFVGQNNHGVRFQTPLTVAHRGRVCAKRPTKRSGDKR